MISDATAPALERKTALDREQRELEALSGLSYLTGHLGEYLHHVASALAALIRVEWVAVTLCDGDGRIRLLASTCPVRPEQSCTSIHGSAAEAVIRTGCTVIVEDVEDAACRVTLPPGYRAYLGVPLRSSRGEVLGTVCSFAREPRAFDDEDRRIGELFAERAATNIDNYQLYESLCATNAELQRQIQAREDFLSIASHELRTPVTSLLLTAHGLGSDKVTSDSEQVRRGVDLIVRQVARLKRLVDDLLSFGEIQVGRMEMHRAPMDLAALVRDEVECAAPLFARAKCEVTLLAKKPIYGCWDHGRVGQVVANLLANAVKFGVGKPIEISVDELGGMARLVVVDHGIGIDAQALPRIFERFERAVSSRSYGGLGLGLYIVRNIIDTLGGSVRVESIPNVETKFTVELPKDMDR